MSDIVKAGRTESWGALLESAKQTKDMQSIMDVVGKIRDMPSEKSEIDITEGVSLISEFNQDNYAAAVGLILIQNYMQLNQKSLFEDDFLDKLLNEVSSQDGVPQLMAGLSEQLHSFKIAMKDAEENCQSHTIARLFDTFDSYLNKEEKALPEVSEAINQLLREYQDATQFYFDDAVIDRPAATIMAPYEQFEDILSADVKQRFSEQVSKIAERSAQIAATHMYHYDRNNPEYAEFFARNKINSEQFLSQDALLDMAHIGLPELADDVLSRAIQMTPHLLPEHKQRTLENFAFAIEYCNREVGYSDTRKLIQWQAILATEYEKVGKIGHNDDLDALTHDV